jgi:excisionase family DNA binding protein
MMLTPKEAAKQLEVSVSLIYQLCNEGRLAHYRFGGRGRRGSVRIEEADLAAYQHAAKRESALAQK